MHQQNRCEPLPNEIHKQGRQITDRSNTVPQSVGSSSTKSSWSRGINHSRNRKKRQSTTRMIQNIGPAAAPSLRVLSEPVRSGGCLRDSSYNVLFKAVPKTEFWAGVYLLVDYFRAFRNSFPAVKFADALVCLRGVMLVFGNDPYRI